MDERAKDAAAADVGQHEGLRSFNAGQGIAHPVILRGRVEDNLLGVCIDHEYADVGLLGRVEQQTLQLLAARARAPQLEQFALVGAADGREALQRRQQARVGDAGKAEQGDGDHEKRRQQHKNIRPEQPAAK